MAKLPSVASINLSVLLPPPSLPLPSLLTLKSPPNPIKSNKEQRQVATSASRSGRVSLNSILKSCKTCSGKGAIECPGCKVNLDYIFAFRLKVQKVPFAGRSTTKPYPFSLIR
ncbi:uncharacterized protein LOC115686735 isoform X2 [Syzygium oleosum]|uniref:uncharacterized protein LOC115686735 isoform X2 n=1 Tax=Syzygium oleosum TaxID=219896 RepID=UPI0024BB5FA5|nr:uncharacterized protein LOC115686735 isoform X2 [Syzygium oleosum]